MNFIIESQIRNEKIYRNWKKLKIRYFLFKIRKYAIFEKLRFSKIRKYAIFENREFCNMRGLPYWPSVMLGKNVNKGDSSSAGLGSVRMPVLPLTNFS